MSAPHVPEPGDLVGWLVVYGDRSLHWTAVLGDETRALLLAAQLRGIMRPLVVGHHLDGLKPPEVER